MQEFCHRGLHNCRAMVYISGMNWDDLRIIAAVEQKGTYAKAGAALQIDETTVARRLTRIQEALGITLFDAVNGVRRPTAHCLAVLDHIDDMSRAAAKIDAIGDDAASPFGTVRVTSTASIAEEILAPDLGRLLGANPGLSIELETSNDNLNFSQWEADLAIRLGKPDRGAFVVRKLGDLRFCLLSPAEQRDRDPAQLVCAYPAELEGTPEMKALDALNLTGAKRLRTSNLGIIRAILRAGTGSGVLPDYCATELRGDANLRITPLDARREVWLLIQPHLKTQPAARLVIDWITERFSTLTS